MKYRILTRNVNINVISFNWLSVGRNPWETEDRQEALGKYRELLDTHSSGDLTLVRVVPVNIAVASDEPGDPGEGGETGIPGPPQAEPPEETAGDP